MVCHGCYDAPCQLKMEAHAGIVRGSSKELVYDGTRLRAANLTRLFDDAQSEQGWREKGFNPVLDASTPRQGVMYRMLQLKQAHPLPTQGPLPEGFDFSLYRDQQCPKPDEFDKFANNNPYWGMPYGLPGLNADEHSTLTNWLEDGAPAPELQPLPTNQQALLAKWETFLNGKGKREQLMSRYLYEHLFLGNLYLDVTQKQIWFRLVRSSTAPGEPIEVIATRRPYDDPGQEKFFYRIQRMPISPLAKTHIPYRFDQARMGWYEELFLKPDYEVSELPGYAIENGSNPFKNFLALPVQSRYRFLLEEAQFTIMNFIKGPVCRGQIALSVIDDHFWVMFANPDKMDVEHDAEFLASELDNLRLPSPKRESVIDMLSWRGYSRANAAYQQARAEYGKEQLDRVDRKMDINSIWDGEGRNDNAALTIFRHFDTASVVRGFVGEPPKTAWVVGYTLLERIHYLLVADFDVYGAASHQLQSRLFMDFLRMEGESNFLMFMPPELRVPMWEHWYRGARSGTRNYISNIGDLAKQPTDVSYVTSDPKLEFLQAMRERIHGARAESFDYSSSATAAITQAFDKLIQTPGAHNSFMPEVSFLNVIGNQRDEAYTLLRSSGYSNISQIFQEEKRRIPEEDKLTVVSGFIGAYPNYFFQVNEQEIPAFTKEVLALESRKDLASLRERYGVRRNAPWFWRLSDKFHLKYQQQDGTEFGWFDYNRYQAN